MAVIPYTFRASSVPTTLVSDRETYLYGISGGDVIRYTTTGSTTNLGSPGANPFSLACFKGNVHCLWWEGTNPLTDLTDIGISYWNGSSWVRTLNKPGNVEGAFFQASQLMALRDVVMVAHIGSIDGASQFTYPVLIYTTDGTNWQTATVEGNDSLYLQPNVVGVPVMYTDTIYMDGNTDHLNVTPPFTTHIYRFVSGNWEEHILNYSTRTSSSYPRIRTADIGKYWQAPSSGNTEYSDNLSSWTTNPGSSDGTITPVDTDNMPYAFGQFFNGVSFYMIPWDDTGLDWLEVDYDIYNRATYGAPNKVFRMNDGKVMVITATGNLLQRDADILDGPDWGDPVPGFGILYWGTNVLTDSKGITLG